MTRQAKSPRQRAEEALGVATRRVKRCQQRVADTETALRAAKLELIDAEQRRKYAAADPALPQPARDEAPESATAEAGS